LSLPVCLELFLHLGSGLARVRPDNMRLAPLILLFVFSFTLSSKAEVFETQIEQASGEDGAYAQFRLWLPAGTHPDRLVALIWGSNQCSLDMVNDLSWQELARSMDCGLMTCFFVPQTSDNHWDHATSGSGQALLDALQTLARTTGESQLTNASLYLIGDSQGGQFAFHFAAWKPSRSLGFVSLKGGHHDAALIEQAARIPGLFFMGQLDLPFRNNNIAQTFACGRAMGAPWCLAIDKSGKHEPGPCAPLVQAFLTELSTFHSNKSSPSSSPAVGENRNRFLSPTYPPSWFPSHKFEQDWESFEMGKLASTQSNLSFESKMPATLGTAILSSYDLASISSGEQSQVLTLQVIPSSPFQWDGVKILDRSYLSDSKVVGPRPQGTSVSFRLNTMGLPLGRFSGVVPLRFIWQGKPISGGLNVRLTANVIGDVAANPAFIFLGPVHPDSKVIVKIQINSKNKAAISLLSCQTPQAVGQVSPPQPGNPLDLTFSFAVGRGSPGEVISGTILLHLETTKEWILRVPYVGSFTE
jgi:hypothetical protein